jgi:TatA/E family protein of Tat protein translocase
MGIDNPVHLIFIAAVALLVLGPRRLPEVARSLGKGIREFRDAMSDGSAGFMHDRHEGVLGGSTSAPVAPVAAPASPVAAPVAAPAVPAVPAAPASAPPAEPGVASPAPAPIPPDGEEIQDADVVPEPAPLSAPAPRQVDPGEHVRSGDAPDRRPL